MTKNLNIKPLVKGMRVEDKAKLIFADRNKRSETSGREGLLTPDEEKALVEDAQNLHQINELNRLNRLFNISAFVMLDIQTAYLNFRLAEGRLLNVLTGLILVGEANDAFDWVIYDLVSQEYKGEQLDDKKFQKEVDEKARELRKKYKGRELSKIYDYFEPTLRGDSYFSTQTNTTSEPNPLLQKTFMQTVGEIKAFNRQIYQHEYIETKAGMELMSDRDKIKITSFANEISEFVSLDGHLALIKMYAEFAGKCLLRTKNLTEPEFLKTIRDMGKATRLKDKEKEEAENEIENAVQKQSF